VARIGEDIAPGVEAGLGDGSELLRELGDLGVGDDDQLGGERDETASRLLELERAVMAAADRAMYKVKASGKNGIEVAAD